MYLGLHVKYPLFLSVFKGSWILSTDFRKILKYHISWKSIQWLPSCCTRKGRLNADMARLRVATCNSPNAPNRKRGDGVFAIGINFIPSFTKMHQLVRKLNWGHTNSAWWPHKPTLLTSGKKFKSGHNRAKITHYIWRPMHMWMIASVQNTVDD